MYMFLKCSVNLLQNWKLGFDKKIISLDVENSKREYSSRFTLNINKPKVQFLANAFSFCKDDNKLCIFFKLLPINQN